MARFLPIHLPRLPRETQEVKFNEAYEVIKISSAAEQLLTSLTSSRKKLNTTLLNLPNKDTAGTVASEAFDQSSAYLALVVGLNNAPAASDAASASASASADASAAPEASAPAAAPAAAAEGEKKEEEKKDDKKDKKKGKKDEEEEKNKVVPLNRGVAYSWSDFSRKTKAVTIGGVDNEIYSTLINLGLYLLVLGSEVLGRGGKEVDAQQKEAYKLFLQAAGVFVYLGDKIADTPGELSDVRGNVSKALAQLSLAEAQTITVSRAEEGGHTSQLISSLARDTSEKFQGAKDTLTSPNPTPNPDVSDTLLAYLEYRKALYLAKAYYHHGQHFALPESTAAGKALKAFQTAIDGLKAAQPFFTTFTDALDEPKQAAAKEFNAAQTKIFEDGFQKMRKENDMVYYEKIPDDAEPLPEAKSTLEVVEYKFPETDKKWTPEVYGALKAKKDAIADAGTEKQGGCCSIM